VHVHVEDAVAERPSAADSGGVNVIWLVTAVAPGRFITARVAASRWYCHATVPESVITWPLTRALILSGGTSTARVRNLFAISVRSTSVLPGWRTVNSLATALTPRTRMADRLAASFSGRVVTSPDSRTVPLLTVTTTSLATTTGSYFSSSLMLV
jgi:hypothetical protein